MCTHCKGVAQDTGTHTLIVHKHKLAAAGLSLILLPLSTVTALQINNNNGDDNDDNDDDDDAAAADDDDDDDDDNDDSNIQTDRQT